MVLTKNWPKAFAPSGVCWVASSDMIGGFSPGLVFGPVVGTSAGRVGCGGLGGPTCEFEGGAAEVVGGGTDPVGSGVPVERGVPDPDEVQAAQHISTTNAANVQIRPTDQMMPHPRPASTRNTTACGQARADPAERRADPRAAAHRPVASGL